MINYTDYGVVWYAMKTTYSKEMRAKAYLDSLEVENFIPMKQEVVVKYGRKTVIQKPVLHNLIFVKVNLTQLNDIKNKINYLHNSLTTYNGVSMPIIVPTQQMEQFIDVITNHLNEIIYVDLTSERIEKGTPVRITDGKFKGYEGVLERVKGKRDRRVHVNIKGIVAYKFDVEAKFVEKI